MYKFWIIIFIRDDFFSGLIMIIISPVRHDFTVINEKMQKQGLQANNEMREEVRAEFQNRVINKSTLSFRAVKCSRAKL